MAKIGVFDSGLGGLSVVRSILDETKGHSICYFGDTAHLPYGSKSVETIKRLSQQAFNFLILQGVDVIIVACNTVSSVALPYLNDIYKIPVIGVVESGVEAALFTNKNRIGIIGTHNTIKSGRYEELLLNKKPDIKILKKPCPLFVPLVEEGIVDGPIADMIIAKYLLDFTGKIDTLILACTHYPALKKTISKFLGNDIELVDASMKIVSYIEKYLKKDENKKKSEFYVTDRPENFSSLSKLFLDKSIKAEIVNIG
ncbi:MAG: glutamate racemase [Candidatus Muirbacterium halophilum]|nr:glutamate racemase [Candidatus Muirbacterium halophilum]MCK9474588.1 glutamate racemase [Candidatus Muirbacterium halophilum]